MRMHFFDDAMSMFRDEVSAAPNVLFNAGKTSRLVNTLLLFAEQEHILLCDAAEQNKPPRIRHNLRTWLYTPRSRKDRQNSISGFRSVATGERGMLRSFVTFLRIGNSRKQLRPLHVEIAVLIAIMTTCGLPMATSHLWNFASVLAKALGMSDKYIQVVIRLYDENLFKVINTFLNKLLAECSFTQQEGTYLRGKDLSELEYDVASGGWSERTKDQARRVALKYSFPILLSEAMSPLTILVAQFWDNISSMTYPICKFENGKNRYIFRMSTGELCTGTTVRPKLGLEEIQAGGEAGHTGAQITGSAIFRRMKPDLQVVTSDDAIDCCINVVLGNKRVMGMRERRALRVCLMLSCYTKYNLDATLGTTGVFDVARRSEPAGSRGVSCRPRDSARNTRTATASLTCNSPPDLISLLLCDQIVTSVSRNGIAVITGFVFRGIHTELILDNEALFVRVRGRKETSHVEIVEGLFTAAVARASDKRRSETVGETVEDLAIAKAAQEEPVSGDQRNETGGTLPNTWNDNEGSRLDQNHSNVRNQDNNGQDSSSSARTSSDSEWSRSSLSDWSELGPMLQPVLVLPQGLIGRDGLRERAKWRSRVCGALRLLTISKSVYLLTRRESRNKYGLHELTDTLSDHSDTAIYVL